MPFIVHHFNCVEKTLWISALKQFFLPQFLPVINVVVQTVTIIILTYHFI